MDLIHKLLNIIAAPFTLFSILFLLPPFLILKFFLSILRSVFSEDVAGKVVCITGASSGIGENIAYEYARKGARLTLAARRENSLREVAHRCEELGSPDVVAIPADVSKVDDCRHLIDETINHFGRLDHMVNVAGITSICLFEETADITNLRPIMDINFWGSVYTAYFAVPHLRESKGKIIVLSSSAAWMPDPRMSIYHGSKAAMISFFETLRIEVAPDVKILIATPGFIESEMTTGKFLSGEGKIEINQDLRDVQVSITPVESAQVCSQAIVNSACRGDRYIAEPAWILSTYFFKVFFPEVIELIYRMLFLTRHNSSYREAASKKILDLTGAKNILYPTSIRSSEVKRD